MIVTEQHSLTLLLGRKVIFYLRISTTFQAQDKLREKETLNRELRDGLEKFRSQYKKQVEETKQTKQQAEDERQHAVEMLSKNAMLENKCRELEVELSKEKAQQKQWRKFSRNMKSLAPVAIFDYDQSKFLIPLPSQI